MGRLILLAVAVLALFWLLRRALRRRSGHAAPPPVQRGGAQGELVRCAHCQTHLPLGEARSAQGRHYCSEEHERLGPGRG